MMITAKRSIGRGPASRKPQLSADLMVGKLGISAIATAMLLALGPNFAPAEAPPVPAQQIDTLFAKLSDDSYSVRNEARTKLESLASAPSTAAAVRSAVEARLAAKPTDWDFRALLESIRRRMPNADAAANGSEVATAEAIDAIFQDLESNRFAVREQAAERLRPAGVKPATCELVMLRIKQRLDEPTLDLESVRRLAPLWTEAWATWLALPNPPAPQSQAANEGQVTDQQIAAQIERLIAAAPAHLASVHPLLTPYAAAERELLYLLARDDTFPRVRDAFEKRLEQAIAESLPLDSFERLQRMVDWTKPAMVAEFWQMGEQKSMQHLLIGVPNQPAGAAKASLFDRCDEKFAHCVSGNSLTPGDWPVGIFFPHPSDLQGDAQFHLKNLPTPRRRMSYDYEVPAVMSREKQVVVDAARRKQITARTCAYWLERKRDLTDREVDMLAYLDYDEISRFVGPYLQSVPDRRIENLSPTAVGNGSAHGNFCYKLSLIGTPEAGLALTAAMEKHRILEPTEETPYRMDWICLLVMGERVPWPGLDDWLAAQIDRTEAINLREPSAADVGASAAALLLAHRGRTPSEFGLERHDFPELRDLENPGFRFSQPEKRAAVKKWWLETKETERKVAP